MYLQFNNNLGIVIVLSDLSSSLLFGTNFQPIHRLQITNTVDIGNDTRPLLYYH